jgi:hypothetical protein
VEITECLGREQQLCNLIAQANKGQQMHPIKLEISQVRKFFLKKLWPDDQVNMMLGR